ncbi:ribonuclease H-like YkuK family protein [Patescibacteria group bacterium]
MMTKKTFNSPSQGKVTSEKMVKELVSFMGEAPDYFYRLVIGTDSKSGQLKKSQSVDFVTAVVIHRKGKGARYFWQKNKVNKIATLRDKIYTETLLSLQLAEKMVPGITKKLNGQRYRLEIHIDVGDNGPTREMIKEVVGMVNGNGYTAKTKPESYGAFCVADKHT